MTAICDDRGYGNRGWEQEEVHVEALVEAQPRTSAGSQKLEQLPRSSPATATSRYATVAFYHSQKP
jgi:hypothetical protein